MSLFVNLGSSPVKARRRRSSDARMKKYSNSTEYSFSNLAPTFQVEEDSEEYVWVQYLKTWDANPQRTRRLVRLGVPGSMRGQVWKRMTQSTDLAIKNPAVYQLLLDREIDQDVDRMIKQDIRRTFPKNIQFKGYTMQGAMYNVLRAYSAMDPNIGYCQGMSFIVGVLLYYLNEEDAFWVFVQMNKTYKLGNLFTPGLPLLKDMLYKLDMLTKILFPELYLHFKQESVQPLMFASEWFSTVFSYNFPLEITARIWDVFLLEGMNYLLQLSLAILKVSAPALVKLKFEKIIMYLKEKGGSMTTNDIIFQVADRIDVSNIVAHIDSQLAKTGGTAPLLRMGSKDIRELRAVSDDSELYEPTPGSPRSESLDHEEDGSEPSSTASVNAAEVAEALEALEVLQEVAPPANNNAPSPTNPIRISSNHRRKSVTRDAQESRSQ